MLSPLQRPEQLLVSAGLVKPELVLRHDQRGADEPHTRLTLFHEDLPSGELLAQRDLSIRTNDLDADFACGSVHFQACVRLLGWAHG